jgi:hypothetical protein
MEKANYQRIIRNTGEIIEIIGTYIETGIMNPPEMLSEKEITRILKIMKKNRIKKLDFIS